MNTQLTHRIYFWISFIVMFIQSQNEAFASHAQSADITYQCLGGNQYQISLSFYRDCAGVTAPNTASINISSASCGQNLTLTLNPVPGTGIEVSPICTQMNTQCSGGSYPGVQEYKYTGIITLPVQCTDWTFSFSLCCRNASINTIVNPSAENIYVEAQLNNLDFPCNSSPNFSNPPIPFVCVGQPYCFNNGSSDADGDSLFYTLITPRTGPGTTVTYNAPYSAGQPLVSSPAVTFNGLTGDMCMWPSQLEVTVFAVLVEEWRNGVLVGTVMRDIQMRTITCTNNNPYVNGINNTSQYSLTACAGAPVNFTISSFDADSAQNVSINWNNGIAAATFTSSGGTRPTGTFSWTPAAADAGPGSHCFTVTVRDDNCPFNGSQTYSFCITVTAIILNTTSTDANCGASNGTAAVQVTSGAGPFSYQWIGGGSNSTQNGLTAGTYTVNVTGAGGCQSSATATVANGAAPGNLVISATGVSCFGGNNGSATANANGGQQPYTYVWSNGVSGATISNLSPGTYSVTLTTANGCISMDSVTITQPSAAMASTIAQVNPACYGAASGSATVTASGGTGNYTYSWNTNPVQATATATSLTAGNYSVTVSDANGCSIVSGVTLNEPPALSANGLVVNHVTCYGANDGYATVGAYGGTGTYNYSWSTTPAQNQQSASGLAPGNYFATVTDGNGCVANSYVTITEPPALALSSAAYPVTCNGACNGQTVVIPSGGVGGYSYQWMPAGGTGASLTGLCPGTYSVLVTDNNGCEVNTALTVTQPAPVVTSAAGSTTICLGQNTTISAGATGGSGIYTFNWAGVGSGANQVVSPVEPVTYIVSATDGNGCSGLPAAVTINVTSLTAANLTVSAPVAICSGTSTTISSSVSGNTGPVAISWNNGIGGGNGPFTVAPASTTTYVVTVTDACSNSITSSVPVTVNPLPQVDLQPRTYSSCSEVTAEFSEASGTNAGSAFHWDFGDGFTSAYTTPQHVYTMTGQYYIELTVTSPQGCVNSGNTIYNVTVKKKSVAAFNAEPTDGTTISPAYKFHNQSSNAVSYSWQFGDGGVASIAEPSYTYADKGIYNVTLIAVSDEGCADTANREIEIKPLFTLYIPNAFTPDGNNTNDNFTAKGDEISEFKMMIFDRWGEMIYQTDDIQTGWDGRATNGSDIAQNGVYVYKIVVRDFESRYHDYTGHVTLLTQK
ncbi:MAG TPA: PKD domain-containing protein [Bacteroidia bacterium]